MRVLFFLVASTVAQTLSAGVTAGANVNWEATSTWTGNQVPTGNLGVTITAAATVTVSSAVTFAQGVTLTLGAADTLGTSLVLNNTGLWRAALFNWNNGKLVLQGNSNFAVVFGATLGGGANLDRQLIATGAAGGTFTLGAFGVLSSLLKVTVNGGTTTITNVYLHTQGGTWAISAGAVVSFSAGATSWLISDVTFNGGGSVQVSGELQSNSTVNFGTPGMSSSTITTNVAGNLTLTANGQAKVNDGSTLIVWGGGALKRWNANAQAAINIAASATLNFTGGAMASSSSWIDANIANSGNIVIDTGATATVMADSTISGSGSLNVNGNLQIAAGVAATFESATFAAGSAFHLAFKTAGSVGTFAAVTVKGALNLAGTIHVDVPVQPSGTVVLATAASITGSFSAVVNGGASMSVTGGAGRRLLSGTVTQNGTAITYTPTSSAGKAGFFVLLPVFTGLALW